MSEFVPKIVTIQFDELTAALEYFRLEKGLTLEEVAKELKFKSPATISHYENGRRKPSLQVIKRLAALDGPELVYTQDHTGAKERVRKLIEEYKQMPGYHDAMTGGRNND